MGEFLTGDPQEITVYNDNVNTGPTGAAFDSKGNVYISEYYSGTEQASFFRYDAVGHGTSSTVRTETTVRREGMPCW